MKDTSGAKAPLPDGTIIAFSCLWCPASGPLSALEYVRVPSLKIWKQRLPLRGYHVPNPTPPERVGLRNIQLPGHPFLARKRNWKVARGLRGRLCRALASLGRGDPKGSRYIGCKCRGQDWQTASVERDVTWDTRPGYSPIWRNLTEENSFNLP